MFKRKLCELEQKLNNHNDWYCHYDVVMLDDMPEFEGEVIVHVFVHRSNNFQIYNGMYTGNQEPYLILAQHFQDDTESIYETYRNLKQCEEDSKVKEFLKKHNLMNEEEELNDYVP